MSRSIAINQVLSLGALARSAGRACLGVLRSPPWRKRARMRDFLGPLGLADSARIALPHQASARRYYRIDAAEGSVVLCEDPEPSTRRRARLIRLTELFAREGIAVPAILQARPEHGLLLFQDLGDMSLERSPDRRGALAGVISDLVNLQAIPVERITSEVSLARMDVDYFRRRADLSAMRIRGLMPRHLGETLRAFSRQRLGRLIESILAASDASCLVHADFQSTNLMMREGRCHFIDFQDAKVGPPLHDLVSLLEDPVLALGDDLRQTCLDRYWRASPHFRNATFDSLMTAYDRHALMRVYDLIGSYLYLGRTGVLKYRDRATALLPRFETLHRTMTDGGLREFS